MLARICYYALRQVEHKFHLLFFVCAFILLEACSTTDSFENLVQASQNSNVKGLEVHGVEMTSFLGRKKIASASLYVDHGPKLEIPKQEFTRLFAIEDEGNSIELAVLISKETFDAEGAHQTLKAFITELSRHVKAFHFDLTILTIPTPYSYTYVFESTPTPDVQLSFAFPFDDDQKFGSLSREILPTLAHEIFHLTQRYASPNRKLERTERFEEEVLATFFETCIYNAVFGEAPNITNNLLPKSFVSPSNTASDDREKRHYIFGHLDGTSGDISQAATAAMNFYLVSSLNAQSHNRLMRLGEICSSVFEDSNESLILSELYDQ